MAHAVFFFRRSVAGEPAFNAAVTENKGFNFKNLQAMKLAMLIISLTMFSVLANAQIQDDKCPAAVVIRKPLYDSFQSAKSNKESWERNLARYRQVLEDLRQKYQDCAHQSDVADFLKHAEDDVTAAETNLRVAITDFGKVEKLVRDIYDDAHNLPVVYRYYDPSFGNLGRVWTMTFISSHEGKIEIVPTYYDLPDKAISAN